MHATADGPVSDSPSTTSLRQLVDILGVTIVFFALSCSPVPDVNEAHYWCKAKHFWDPTFCAADSFLNSADAHWSFYLTLGQLTRFLSLENATWAGRWIVWLAMAGGWCSLAKCFDLRSFQVWLSAALLVVVTRWCHLSGEWVVGGAEAKGLAFGAVFLALGAACRGRWGTAFLAGGVGAGFHVLVGGWTVLCLLLVGSYFLVRSLAQGKQPSLRNLRPVCGGLAVGGLISLGGLWPALGLATSASPDLIEAANSIYVLQRLPHHLVFWAFQPIQLLMFCGLVLIWLTTLTGVDHPPSLPTKENPRVTLILLVHAALGLSAVGLGWSLVVLFAESGNAFAVSCLRYYWFRTADVFLPIGVVLLGCQAVFSPYRIWKYSENEGTNRTWSALGVRTVMYGLIVWSLAWEVGLVYQQAVLDPRPNADKASLPSDQDFGRTQAIFQHWKNVCDWIRHHTRADAIFLTPRSQQTFKWYAHRSEVVNWKDVPQDSQGLLDWQQRVVDSAPLWSSDLGIAIQDPVAIHELAMKYDVDYLVMTQYAYELQHRFGRQLPYRRVYPESAGQRSYYVVLAIHEWQSAPSDQP
mgnify:CR=1 FL=1